MRSFARRLSLALVAGGLALAGSASAQSPLPFPFPEGDPHDVPPGDPIPATPIQALVSAATSQAFFNFAFALNDICIATSDGFQANADLRLANASEQQISAGLAQSINSINAAADAGTASFDARVEEVRLQVLALGGTEADLAQLTEVVDLIKTLIEGTRLTCVESLVNFAALPELPPPYNGQPLPPAPFPFPIPDDPTPPDEERAKQPTPPAPAPAPEKPKEKPKHAENSDTDRKSRDGSRR